MSRRRDDQTWAIYCRSFLATAGIALGIFATYLMAGSRTLSEPALAYAVLYGLALAFILVGLLAPNRLMLRVAEVVGHDLLSVVLLAVAFPLYLAIRPFYGGRR